MTPVKRPGGEPDNIPTMNASGDEKEKESSRDKAFKSASLYLDRRSRGPALIPVFRRRMTGELNHPNSLE
jgi:hypothetical protein